MLDVRLFFDLCNINSPQEMLVSYDGQRSSSGLPHGSGVAEFRNGSRYEGEWNEGRLQGRGRYTFYNGLVYNGPFHSNENTGYGTYRWTDGDVYEGDILDGLPHGHGTLRSPVKGAEYRGEWRRGLKHGVGTLTTTHSSEVTRYTGEWLHDQRHGQGVMAFPSGNKYEGEWRNGMMEGRGTMHWYNRNERYSGDWIQNRPHGEGELLWGTASASPLPNEHNNYRGRFVNGLRDGYGELVYADGSIYEGEFCGDAKHGFGCYWSGDVLKFGSLRHDKFLQGTPSLTIDSAPSGSLIASLRAASSDPVTPEALKVEIEAFLKAWFSKMESH